MTFRYRSPADLSINLGGLGSVVPSYVTSQNGCSPFGTHIRYEDTSRYEGDYVGNQFWMPYQTDIVADGNCGEVSGAETWGLQYFPAGWVTNTTTTYADESWNFTDSLSVNHSGTVAVFSYDYHFIEDGTGINTQTLVNTSALYQPNQIVDFYNDGYTNRWAVNRNNANDGFDLFDYTMFPPYGNYLGGYGSSAEIYVSEVPGSYVAGTSNYSTYSDGYGGSWDNLDSIYWATTGTVIVEFNQVDENAYDANFTFTYWPTGRVDYDAAIMNGSPGQYGDGSYHIENLTSGNYYSQGTPVTTFNGVANYSSWQSYSFDNGTNTYDQLEWDGIGGFQVSYGLTSGSYYPLETYIGNYLGDDSNNYDLYWDGYGGIYGVTY